jgi:hypothetical protein
MRTSLALALSLTLGLVACAPAEPPKTPASAAPAPTSGATPEGAVTPVAGTPAAPADPFAVAAPLREETLPSGAVPPLDPSLRLPETTAGVPKAPALCAPFEKRKATKAPACDTNESALAALDGALAELDEGKRDAALLGLEGCAGLSAGLVRALRVDLAPPVCGDLLAAPVLAKPPSAMRGDVQQALVGQALAARLARLSGSAPKLAGAADKAKLMAHLGGPVLAWMKEQATAVQDLSAVGVKLGAYGRAIVAVEAGLADLRLVEALRELPLPSELAKDDELKTAYYAALDEVLEPRKARGRDAALVGLRDLATVGVLRDARVTRARELLSKMYGGRRIDALDGLLLPPLAAPASATVAQRLAARLPTFHAGILLDTSYVKDPTTLRALLERGLSVPHRAALRGALAPDVAVLVGRARIGLGQVYWRALDFDEAAAALASVPAASRSEEGTFLLALAIALRGGPEDASGMIRNAPVVASGMGRVVALDALAAKGGTLAGAAAFDAARVLELVAPEGASAAYFRDVSARYAKAATLLPDSAKKAEAEERSKAAAATAAAVR